MGRFIDMTGWVMSEHGVSDSRLTVVERAEDGILPSGKHITRWKCKCECGNETIVSRDQLVRKNGTKSCGCLHKEIASKQNFKDLTGQRFGKLTVLERVNPPEYLKDKHSSYWKCKCDCGNLTVVKRNALIDKRTRSCGCIHDEKSGERLCQMFTKNYRRYDEDGSVIEKFCPECQKWHPIENFSKRKANLDGYEWMCNDCKRHSLKSRYSAYKGGAKHRGLEFYLSIEEFDKITKNPCIYCGEYNGSYLGTNFNGIDRVDPLQGYVASNCVPCCSICNSMKTDMNVNDWIAKIKKILTYYNYKELDKNV